MAKEQDSAPVEPVTDPAPAPDTPETVRDPLDDPVTPAEQQAIERELERKAKPITLDPPSDPPTPPVPPKPTLTKEPPAWMWWAAFALVVTGTVFAIVYTYRQGRAADEGSGGSPRPS